MDKLGKFQTKQRTAFKREIDLVRRQRKEWATVFNKYEKGAVFDPFPKNWPRHGLSSI